MFFQNIKGHEDLLDTFKEWILNDKFKGVYLFEGPKGIGKYSIAKYLSRYLICLGVKDDSCNCNSCKLFPNSPDYLEISSDEESVIKSSDVDAIDEFVTLRPFKGTNKVIIIDDVERLNNTSASQLLKTLEDLKDHVIVFLVSSYPERVIPTILSRTKRVFFNTLHPTTITELLKERDIPAKRVNEFNRMIPFLSKSLLSNYSIYTRYINLVLDFIMDFNKKEEDDLLSIIDSIDSENELIYFLEIFLIYICDILKIHFDNKHTIFGVDNPLIFDKLTIEWKRDLCVAVLEKLRPVIVDYKKGVNIRLKPRVASLISWVYLIAKKEKMDAEERAKK
jgi:replication-associated recombination protein RarA